MLSGETQRRTSSLPSCQLIWNKPEKQDEKSSIETNVRQTNVWRWIIVFSSFCIHFIADGVLFSFGILMHEIKNDLKIELHTVGIIASLFVSLPLVLAPISSALVNKFGCRLIAMLGGFLCSMGLLFASLMGNFNGAVIGIGVTCGMGLACVYVPVVVIVAHYFDDNRAIATAIAVGGTGLGNAVVAQLIHKLNDYYSDWRDTTFFLSGVMFIIVGFGVLFRPIEFYFSRKETDHRLPPSCMTSMEKLQRFIQTMDKQSATRQTNLQSINFPRENLIDSYSADDIEKLERKLHENDEIISFKPSLSRYLSLRVEKQEEQLLEVYYQPISQKDIFYRGNVPKKCSNLSPNSCPNLLQSYVDEEPDTTISDVETTNSTYNPPRRLSYQRRLTFLHTVKRMLGLHLFHDYRYVIFFLSQFLFYLFYDLIYLFPVDYGETVMGYSKQQMTSLVTILGFGQFFGQLFYGLLANYSKINELILYDIGAILCGISSLLIPFVVHSYILLVFVILVFGLSISANYVLTPIILGNMCGLELLTSAYGLILLGQGLSSLSGPIIGGWIAEHYGYKCSLIVAGVFMSISGFISLSIPFMQKFHVKKEETIRTNTTITTSDD